MGEYPPKTYPAGRGGFFSPLRFILRSMFRHLNQRAVAAVFADPGNNRGKGILT